MSGARPRNRQSAKAAGARFVRSCVDWLQGHGFPFAEVAPSWGAKDRGDVTGVRTLGGRHIVIECKNAARLDLAGWAAEAEAERVNDAAVAGVVFHKRHGVSDPGRQWVTLTLQDFAALVLGLRPGNDPIHERTEQ